MSGVIRRVGSLSVISLALACAHPVARVTQSVVVADTSDTGVVTAAILHVLDWRVKSVAHDTGTMPLTWSFPSASDSLTWDAARSQLFEALRGRPPADGPGYRTVIAIKRLKVRGNALFAEFTVGGQQHCGGRWLDQHTRFEVRAVRNQAGVWGAAAISREPVPEERMTLAATCEFLGP